jgi:hypothetical protein
MGFFFLCRFVYLKRFISSIVCPDLEPFSQLNLASRSSKLDLILIGFDKKNHEKIEPVSLFFLSEKRHHCASHGRKSVPPREINPCLSQKEKNVFFVSMRHDHGARGSKTMHLTEEKKHVFLVSERHDRASRGSKSVPPAEEEKKEAFFRFQEA